MGGFRKKPAGGWGTRKPSARKKRSPRAAQKKQTKREQEGSGSRWEFRVKCCLSLMLTPAKRPSPCVNCRKKRYHVTYDADPDPSRITRRRQRKNGKTYTFTEYAGYYCEHEPVGVAFRDRAGDETTACERVRQGRTDAAFVESERIRCEMAEHMAAQNRA